MPVSQHGFLRAFGKFEDINKNASIIKQQKSCNVAGFPDASNLPTGVSEDVLSSLE